MRAQRPLSAGVIGAAVLAAAAQRLTESDAERRQKEPDKLTIMPGKEYLVEMQDYEEPPTLVHHLTRRKGTGFAFAAAALSRPQRSPRGVRFHEEYRPPEWTKRIGDFQEAELKRLRKAEKRARDTARTEAGKLAAGTLTLEKLQECKRLMLAHTAHPDHMAETIEALPRQSSISCD